MAPLESYREMMARLKVQRPLINPNTLINLTTASAQVFATPELVEKILEYLPPIALYGFRRVSSTFKDSVDLPKFRESMLLDSTNDIKINIPRLHNVFHSHGIQEAIAPLLIGRVFTTNSEGTLCIRVRTFDYWAESHGFYRGNLDIRYLPCGYAECSWRQMKIDRGDAALKFYFDVICDPSSDTFDRNRGSKEYQGGEEVTLGQLVEDCVEMYYAHQATPWNAAVGPQRRSEDME